MPKDIPLDLHPATLLETVAATVPEAPALAHGTTTVSWADFEARAARLSGALRSAGLGPGSKVGILMFNGPEWIETYFAALKLRAVPVNVNYRYVADELRYLLDDCDAEALVFHGSLGSRLVPILAQLPSLRLLVEVDDGEPSGLDANAYEDLLAASTPMEPVDRFPSDLWMTYTGGTTGMPKGVMTNVGRVTGGLMQMGFGGLGAEIPADLAAAQRQVADIHDRGMQTMSVIGPPLMHPTGLVYGAVVPHFAGGCAVTLENRSFDPALLLDEIDRRRATNTVIAGEVFSRPIVDLLDSEAGRRYDLSSLRSVFSSGMIWNSETKRRLLEHIPQATLIDVVGSSEGAIGQSRATKGNVPETGVFEPLASTKVLRSDGTPVDPGEPGILAASGGIVGDGYYKDEEKSAKTYFVLDGVKHVMAGDWATVEPDGRIRFLGRESSCINTGGEKVYAEEVENVIKDMAGVADCLVVGVPDDRWGNVVAAVVAPAPGGQVDPVALKDHAREHLAGYKLPRRVALVDQVPRAANAKADYKAARQAALAGVEV